MVNLLIAMMAASFTRIEERSAQEHAQLRCEQMFTFRYIMSSFPPVLNAPASLYDLLTHFGKVWKLWRRTEDHPKVNAVVRSTTRRLDPNAPAEPRRRFSLTGSRRPQTPHSPPSIARADSFTSESAAIEGSSAPPPELDQKQEQLVRLYFHHEARLMAETQEAVSRDTSNDVKLLTRRLCAVEDLLVDKLKSIEMILKSGSR